MGEGERWGGLGAWHSKPWEFKQAFPDGVTPKALLLLEEACGRNCMGMGVGRGRVLQARETARAKAWSVYSVSHLVGAYCAGAEKASGKGLRAVLGELLT